MPHHHSNPPIDAAATEGFIRLLGAHEQQLSAYVLSLVPRWHDARDIVQEVRVRLWQQFDKYDSQQDFGAWSRAIAYYEVLSYRTRRGREKVLFSEEVVRAVSEEAAKQAASTDARQNALIDCLSKLQESQKKLLLRCYEQGSTVQDVAREESRSYESLRKVIYRLRRVLHECIESTLAAEGSR